jgi:hypothetical protein
MIHPPLVLILKHIGVLAYFLSTLANVHMVTYCGPLHNAIKPQENYGFRVAAILFYFEKIII